MILKQNEGEPDGSPFLLFDFEESMAMVAIP